MWLLLSFMSYTKIIRLQKRLFIRKRDPELTAQKILRLFLATLILEFWKFGNFFSGEDGDADGDFQRTLSFR